MKSTKVILINGKKRSGKDYFAKLMQEELYKNEKTSEIISFADPIKKIVSNSLGITLEDLEDLKNEKQAIITRIDGFQTKISDFRLLLQNFGTEAMKEWFGDDVWLNLAKKRIQETNVDFVLIPDFRFLVEEISDITVKIKNDVIDQNCNDTHASENELNDFNFKYIIDNTGYKDISKDVAMLVQKII